MIRPAAVLFACLLLGACAVGPSYRAPETVLAPAFRNAPAGAATPESSLGWWKAFNDPVLNALEDEALVQNLDIAAASARVQQARAGSRAASAALLPAGQVTVQGASQYASIANSNAALARLFPGYQRDGSLYDVTAGASWELDVFGGLRREREAADADYLAAIAGVDGARLIVAADLADHYLVLRGYQARLAVARDQEVATRRLLDLVTLRVEAGEAPRRDRDGAEAGLAQVRAGEAQLRLAIETELNAITLLLGRPAEADRSGLEIVRPLPALPPIPAAAPGDLLRRRPDLISAERKLAAANARIGAAIADYYPRVSLQGLLGFEATRTSRLFTSAAQEQQGLLGLKWRLFDFGRVDAEVAAARGREAEALAGYRQAVLRATGDVENALKAGQEQSVRAAELTRATAALERQRRAAEDAYTAGQVSLLEVLDAERQRLSTEDQAIGARTDTLRAAVALHRALGG